jgi:hypothetical protein
MINSQVERRADVFQNSLGEKFDAAVVTEGMRLQAKVNTVTAIEYMKNRGISAAIIQRVLTGVATREEDKEGIGAGA